MNERWVVYCKGHKSEHQSYGEACDKYNEIRRELASKPEMLDEDGDPIDYDYYPNLKRVVVTPSQHQRFVITNL